MIFRIASRELPPPPGLSPPLSLSLSLSFSLFVRVCARARAEDPLQGGPAQVRAVPPQQPEGWEREAQRPGGRPRQAPGVITGFIRLCLRRKRQGRPSR